MHLSVLSAFFVLSFACRTSADTPATVLIPFGDAAVWAAGLEEVQNCRDSKCDEEMKYGVPQALKYALNNARIAIKHAEKKDAKMGKKYIAMIDKFLIELEKVEEQQAGKAWDKKFAKCANSILSLFEDGKFVKVLKDTKVALDVPSDNIGLTWRSQSYDLPLYSGDKLKKGLAELKIEMANGVKIPRVGFGTWQMEGEECANAVLAALKAGYRHIDTAQSYENEKDVQKGIEAALKEGVIGSRDEIFLASKLSEPSAYNEKNAAKAFTSQLRQLKTNYIDMYMLHGPESAKKNLAAWKAMTKLQKEGKIRALGVSNFESEKDLKILSKKQEIKPSYIQNKFSIYNPGAQGIDEKSMLHVAEERGMAFVAYSILNPWPMVLSQMHDPHVIAVSKRYNQTTAQVLNRWALQLNVAIIPKSKSAERIQENARVLEFALGEIDMRLLNGLSTLAQSTSELYPPFVQDVYGLFTADDEVTKSSHDEL